MSTSSLSNALTSIAPQTTTTGSSTFCGDLQASVTRALEIAALPMQALQQDQSTISGETSELSTLSGLFNSLQTSLREHLLGNRQQRIASYRGRSVRAFGVRDGQPAGRHLHRRC